MLYEPKSQLLFVSQRQKRYPQLGKELFLIETCSDFSTFNGNGDLVQFVVVISLTESLNTLWKQVSDR